MESRHGARAPRWVWVGLLGLVVVAIVPAMVAAWSLRPFEGQTGAVLARAFAVRRAAPWVAGVALLGAVGLAWRTWRPARWFGRMVLVAGLAAIGVAVWAARQEYFEWMFAPMPKPGFVRAAEADFVAPGDMVLGVAIGGDAAAYPVRELAYHHVVNDAAGGTPIVATY
jgi:hypothetical protein